ncbi:MAG: lysine--tRNA ligase, partial [Bryobacteraceae bacterium]|nr:lysine--tRNA ligase [Bryobacteraceae bacterium]
MSLETELLKQRAQRIDQIQKLGYEPYGRRFEFTHTIPAILHGYGSKSAAELADPPVRVRLCGRVETIRRMGKAGF